MGTSPNLMIRGAEILRIAFPDLEKKRDAVVGFEKVLG
jgi:hypothetical protein